MEDLIQNKKIRLEIYLTEREGMIVENKIRESLGQSLAYNKEAFDDIVADLTSLL